MKIRTNPYSGSKRFHLRPVALSVMTALFTLGLAAGRSHALPVGEQVTAGAASVQRAGSSVTITQSTPNAAINWQAFGIAAGESVRFSQPAASSIVLNRVVGQDPSQIMGSLSSNGQVFLLNPNGVIFGPGAQVSVGGIVASTLSMSDADFMAGRHSLTRGATAGSIVNQGSIVASKGGYVALVAQQVRNEGTIITPGGTSALASGDKITLTLDNGSLLGLNVDRGTLNGLVENRQAIRADGGVVILTAKAMDGVLRSLINNTGIIEAGRISGQDGIITLEASDVRNAGTIAASQVGIRATGDITLEQGSSVSASGPQGGGAVSLIAGGIANVSGVVEARGETGVGGRIDILGDLTGVFGNASVDASGRTGGGTILIGGDVLGGALTSAGVALPTSSRTVLGGNASLRADAIDSGDGGKVVLWSNDYTGFHGSISARGGAVSGNGGFVETSSKQNLQALGRVDAAAPSGMAGQWLLDPNNITIQTAGVNTNVTASPDFTTTNDNAIVTTGSIQAALNAGTSVTVTASSAGANTQPGDITVANAIAKTAGGAATLTLNAANNIAFNTGANVTSTAGALGLTLNAPGAITTLRNVNLLGGALTLNATGNGTQAGVISGNTSLVKSGAGTFTLTSANTYTGTTTISAGTLQVGAGLTTGALGTGGAVTNNGTLTFNRSNALTVANVIGGSGALVQAGAGTTTLSGANSYAGTTSVNAGTVVASNATALGTTAAGTTVAAGATLNVNAVAIGAEDVTLTGTGVAAAGALTGTGTGSLAGAVSLAGNSSFGGAGTLTLSGAVSGAATLTKVGVGTLVLSGVNSYSGSTALNAGTLSIASDSALGTAPGGATAGHLAFGGGTLLTTASFTLNANRGIALNSNGTLSTGAGTNLTYEGIADGTGALVKTGTGTLTLGGANTYTGATTISAGTLALNATGTIEASSGVAATGAFTIASDKTIDSLTGAGASALGGTLTIGDASNRSGTYTGVASGAGGLTTAGTGTLTLGGINTFTGATTIGAGSTLALNAAGRLGVNSGVANAGTFTIAAAKTIDSMTGSGATVLGGTLTIGDASNTTATYDGAISGTGGLIKAGTGVLTLGGTNTYTGTTTLTAGTLRVANDSAVGGGTLILNAGTLQGDGTARTLANAVTLAASSTIAGTSALTLAGALTNTGALTLTVNNTGLTSLGDVVLSSSATNRTLTFAGTGNTNVTGTVINGSTSTSGITKTGAGTLALSGTNTYSGTTTVSAGTLQVGNDSAVGTGTLTLGGGTLQGDGTTRTLANAVSLSASSSIAGASDLTLSGALTNTTSGSPTLTVNNTGLTTLGSVALSNSGTSRTVTIAGSGNTRISGVISNGSTSTASALAKTGTGTLTLGAANTYRGATTISAGTLALGIADAVGASSAVTVAAAGTFDLNGFSDTIGSLAGAGTVTSGAAGAVTLTSGGNNTSTTFSGVVQDGSGSVSLAKAGTGTLTLSGANTYTGATALNAGTLSIAADSALGTVPAGATAGHLAFGGGTLLTTASFNLEANRGIALNSNGTLSTGAGTNLTYAGIADGAGALVKAGTGTLTLGGANTYTGATTISAGTLALNATGTIEASSGVAATGAFTIASDKTIDSLTGAGASALGGTLTIGDASNTSGTYTGVAGGAGGLTTAGTGTLTLGGINTFTGATTIGAGSTLALNAGGRLGVNSGVANAGTFTIAAAKTIDSMTGSGATVLGGTLTIGDASNTSGTYEGVLSGAGGLTKAGTGSLTLTGANTYTGVTSITAGTLRASNAAALGDTAAGTTVASGATLEIAGGIAIGAEALTLSGTGVGANGALIVASGSGSYGGAITLGASTSLGGDGRLTLGGTLEGDAGGTSALTQAGSGTLTFGGTVGATDALAAVTTSDGQATAINGGSVRTTGAQNYGGRVTTTGTLTLTSTNGGAINANNAGNDFKGNLVLSTAGSASILDSNALALGASSVATLTAQAAAGDLVLNGAITASGGGDAIVLAASANFVNNIGAGALSAPNGRWLVYSTSPAGSTENGLTAAAGSSLPRLYDRTFTANGPTTIGEAGNHLIYGSKPALSVSADNKSRAYGDANPAFTYTTGGFVVDDGVADTAGTAGLTGEPNLTTSATGTSNPGLYAINAAPGTLLSSAGYGLSFIDGSLTVGARPIPVMPNDPPQPQPAPQPQAQPAPEPQAQPGPVRAFVFLLPDLGGPPVSTFAAAALDDPGRFSFNDLPPTGAGGDDVAEACGATAEDCARTDPVGRSFIVIGSGIRLPQGVTAKTPGPARLARFGAPTARR